MRGWFVFTFFMNVIVASILTKMVHLMFFLSKKQKNRWSRKISGFAFGNIFRLNPHIDIQHAHDDLPEWEALNEGDQKPFVVINHTSPLDSIFFSAMAPAAQIQHLASLAKSSLFKVPFFGSLLEACGHFPVYFSTNKANLVREDFWKNRHYSQSMHSGKSDVIVTNPKQVIAIALSEEEDLEKDLGKK